MVPYGIRPVQYDVRTAWYNYTRRDGTTYAEMLLSRNGTKTGWYMILAYDVTLSVRCSDACPGSGLGIEGFPGSGLGIEGFPGSGLGIEGFLGSGLGI